MDWDVESLSILLTGVLFVGIVLAGLTPFVALSPMSFVAFGAAGMVFIGAAFALARVPAVHYPPLMWVLPVLPLLIIGVLGKDAVAARRVSPLPEHATAIARPGGEPAPVALGEAPTPATTEPGKGGGEPARLLASSAHVTPNELAHMAINNPELRPVIALNPLTPVSVLQWLAQQGSPEAIGALDARRQPSTAA
jgi:hypothetical protein